MKAIDIIIGVGWIVFCVYWLVMAATAKAGRSQWKQFAGVRVGIILVVLLLLRLRVFKGNGTATSNPWLLGIGLAIFVLGMALAVWARVYLGRNWGMPMSQKADPELVTTGPYGKIRHPIYSGIILGMVGTAIAVSLYWWSRSRFSAPTSSSAPSPRSAPWPSSSLPPTRPTSAPRRCSSRTSSDCEGQASADRRRQNGAPPPVSVMGGGRVGL